MKVDNMRRIDFWVGVPLCALLTAVSWLWRRVRPATARKTGRDILFIELSEMGSTILADPAMRRVQDNFPDARLYFLIFAANRPSLEITGTISPEQVLTIRADNFVSLALDSLRAIWTMRRLDLMASIDLELFSRYSALLTFLSGAKQRVGFYRFHNEGLYRGELLTHRVAYNPHMHIAKNFLSLVEALSEPQDTVPFSKSIFSDDDIRLVPHAPDPTLLAGFRSRLLDAYPVLARHPRWIILNPNSSELMPLRRWPVERYLELARRLLEQDGVALVLTGTASERPEAEAIAAQLGSERVAVLCGFTRLTELPLLYSLSEAMVTNDSGPAHFAAPSGLRTVVLFGPETPALYGALNPNARFVFAGLACSPCVSASNHRKSACTEARCMTAITVEAVVAQLAQ
ncbi:glycosyltransferase family 9 protein [Magnetospirillum molischianum]|uniref:ADP-heptose n=1 Tax=Magnetospirillum molischianum DSM 120 TaxID=1150626 RepID=H8FTD1_MAGML|nr:glycosyltransferase family 9 protein [Magnetospirillum molischianum]CCG41619.1 ADP-heptose [Magnetospirillum molischianum DSM 120]